MGFDFGPRSYRWSLNDVVSWEKTQRRQPRRVITARIQAPDEQLVYLRRSQLTGNAA